jgi:hypothetical protein
MTDKETFNEFAKGVTLTIGVMSAFILLLVLVTSADPTPEKKFTVVDKYEGGCDVVRYTDETQRWHYFLDCRKGG